ncbi:mitochondrial substrate carrier family protein [Actinidia rufa]|uniref:Mitochondrial substrate carrier family protein n=1 Tax=Actinidia rufa TaxID=165716 RepID=A0A7J0H666_9ERIC|nr:mitochondrial substrate carrier family protein [Actinidia rufa]
MGLQEQLSSPIPHGPHQIYDIGLYISLAHSLTLSLRRPWLAPARPVEHRRRLIEPRQRLIRPVEHRRKLIEPRQRLIKPRRRLIGPVEHRRRLIEPRQNQIEPRRRLIEPVEPRCASEEDWGALPSCLGRASVALLPQKRRFADLRKKRHLLSRFLQLSTPSPPHQKKKRAGFEFCY